MDTTNIEASLNAQVVDQINGVGVTRGELSAAFDRVKDKANWKNPIDAIVILSSGTERLILESAIVFFTGSLPTMEVIRLEPNCSTYRIRADGYYQAIGA